MSLNDDAWDTIFTELRIVEQVNAAGYIDITAPQIKRISQREPRLMTKIDFREQLPPAMRRENLAILAIANGTYRIGRFDPFITIETKTQATAERVTFPSNIITLNPQGLAHESAALDAALVSGVLRGVFGEDVSLTIRGRSRNDPFSFTLNNVLFPVSGVQIEVDGGYEGATTVNLVEAKIGARSNINVRQLIYPQLAWEQAIGQRKTVRSFICFYQEPILRFIPVILEGSLCRADHQNERAFTLEPEAQLRLTAITARPDAPLPVLGTPFPQADRFDTVLAMFGIVAQQEEVSKEALLLDFDIVPRQIDYYSNAMRWLGLVDVEAATIRLTAEGRRVSAMSHAERMRHLANIIFGEPIFHYVLHHRTNDVPPTLFERWDCGSASTMQRRLHTVNAWIRYFETFAESQ